MDSSSTPMEHEDPREHESESEEEEDLDTPTMKRKTNPGASSSSPEVCNKKTRSKVWESYTRVPGNDEKCKCHYCGRIMSCITTSGTSNLRKHLLTCKQFIAWESSGGKSQTALNPDTSLKMNKVSESVVREATNEMLVLGELPLAFVESLAWRHFCNKVNLYSPHSRRTATRDIYKMFANRKEAMRTVFSKTKQRVSLTTDIWTAPTTQNSYMVITAHFIDASWKLRKLIIGFKNVDDHKGTSISDALLQCLEEWGIEKVFTVTVDNATANTSALRYFTSVFQLFGNNSVVLGGEFLHMRCAAHILNLVVRDGFHEVDKSVMAIRNGVQYVRSSRQRLKSFEQKLDSGKQVTRGSLSLDCKTRWNSTYLMLTRAIKFKSTFDRMEAEDKLYNEYFMEVDKDGHKRVGPPSSRDWEAVDRLVQFLIIFYNATLVVSASSSLNAHKCYTEISTIEKNLIRLSASRDEDMRSKANSMRAKFDKYWAGLREINRMVIIASVLDPTNKMQFAQHCFDDLYGKDSAVAKGLQDSVLDVMRRMFDEYSLIRNSSGNSGGTASQSAGASSQASQSQDTNIAEEFDFEADDCFGYERMDSLYKQMVNERGFQDCSNELELYLKEPVENPQLLPGHEYDVLGWWRLNAAKFPVLSEIARDVLAMQVSSVASESAFSTSGRVLDPYRSCLTHYSLEVLMCTQQWLKCEIHFSEKGALTNTDLLADIELQDKLEKEFADIRL